ncbi:polysaccharide deacetylase family protein [Candidatus Poriferisodalis sp.]|uniref:polysaccharide deacetylase family protein n=1 Tax=Candidatus Poriferisodalis sp. TaxID=3101277 RepID=UPI003B027EA9
MCGFRGHALVGVLGMALICGACNAQFADEGAPDTATPDDAATEGAATPETSVEPPPTSTSAAPRSTSEAPTGEADGPPIIKSPLESRDTDADVPEEERFATAVEATLASSFPDRAFALQPGMVQGDLNGDGIDDYVLHVTEEASGSLPTDWLVPAVDAGGAFRLREPIELGRRVIIETIDIRDNTIEVSLFDRSPYEPPTVITRRVTLSIRVDSADEANETDSADAADGTDRLGASVTATRVEPIHNMPSLQLTRSPVPVAFQLDEFGAAMSERIELRERHPFVVHASEDDVMVATLEAPDGVWLEARLSPDTVLVPVAEQTQRFASRLPEGGAWHVTVVSSLIEPTGYRLSIEVLPLGKGDRIATRDLDGFWSSTRTSPPVVPDDGPTMYLTFDDGPHPTYTPQVLDVLAKHGAQATFFVVGYLAERHPLIVQRIAHEGHTLANHSWDHRSVARMSRAAFDRSVSRTQEILGPLATACIRPPYYDIGTHTQQWSAEHGLRLASWSYSPHDWKRPSARTIASGIVNSASAGAVILLHDGGGNRSSTVRGLDMALEQLADSGFEFKALCR